MVIEVLMFPVGGEGTVKSPQGKMWALVVDGVLYVRAEARTLTGRKIHRGNMWFKLTRMTYVRTEARKIPAFQRKNVGLVNSVYEENMIRSGQKMK